MLSITFLLFLKTKWYEKLLIVLDVVSLVLTQSFGAYIAIGIVFVVFIIRNLNWRLLKSWLILLFLIIALVGFFSYFVTTDIGSEVYEKLRQKIIFFLEGDWKNFGSSRLELYEFSWDNIKNNFLFGFDC